MRRDEEERRTGEWPSRSAAETAESCSLRIAYFIETQDSKGCYREE